MAVPVRAAGGAGGGFELPRGLRARGRLAGSIWGGGRNSLTFPFFSSFRTD